MYAALQTVRGAVQRLVPTFLGRYGRLADSEHDLRHHGQLSPQQQAEPRQGASGSGGPDHRSPDVPAFAYPLLVAAVFAVSSAAAVFSLMEEVPAITLAAWRLQLTSVLLGLGAAVQWRGMDADTRSRALHSGWWLAGSGACLAVHFGAWVWGLQHTSLTHSLLMVSATPLLLAGVALATGAPISRGELAGTVLGLAGAVVLSVGAAGGREQRVGLAGDLASLLASAVMVGYLSVGRRLRRWMPIFVYAFPVTGSAALWLTLAGLAVEGVSLTGSGSSGSLGWLTSGRHTPWVLYLALGPGIVGHTGFNTLLRYLSPLTVALAFQMEPLVGSVIGWAAGVMRPPGALTYVGGALVVGATVWVTVASTRREQQEKVMGAGAKGETGGEAGMQVWGSRSADVELERLLAVKSGGQAAKT